MSYPKLDAIFRRIERGDESAVDDLIKEMEPALTKIASSAGNPGDFDDLVQAGRIGVVKASRTYDSSRKCSTFTWCYNCALHEVQHWVRDNTNIIRVPSHLTGADREAATRRRMPYECLNRATSRSYEMSSMRYFLSKLPASQQSLIISRVVYGMSWKEMAEKFDAKPNTVRAQTMSALARLRDIADEKPESTD